MNDLDKMIREALAADEAELLDEVGGEQSLLDMVRDSFRGKSRWLIGMVMAVQFAFMGLTIWSIVGFIQATETKTMLAWGGGFFFGLMTVAMLKVWYWMELNKNSVTREVKRLELQVAHLARRQSD